MNRFTRTPLVLSLLCTGFLVSCGEELQEAAYYRVDVDFPTLPPDIRMGQAAGIATDEEGHVIVFHREEKPFLFFDTSGNFLRSIGEEKWKGAHGLRVDKYNNIWVTDYLNHTVKKFDHDGHQLLMLGEEGVAGDDAYHFNQPTDIAFAANDDFYVSDGYGNSRVAKYNAQGQFLMQWGSKGNGPGQFNLPHAVQLDSQGNVYVGDRENFRIQIFTPEGQYLREITGMSPYGMFISATDVLFVADGKANRVYKMSLTGDVLDAWGGGPGNVVAKELNKKHVLRMKEGSFSMPHAITVGADGAVYVSEINGQRVQKFVPNP
jgi:peptidylamidoglycolate lyase